MVKPIPYYHKISFNFEMTDLILLTYVRRTIIYAVYLPKLTIIYSLQKYLTLYQTLYQKCMKKITL